ncbi:two-component regulator propeller domain-containing protein [Rheinheimera sp. 1928-s]|uniref:two-component regulator propeller domain-containing protein n=1 Tax=Rheinheimera sp. 1928-s TaxID=3033803 RepID=UPI002637E5EF|nr:two-component regulator propeller domain-containing protein [Rheinheimera sp. 1928-s]MDF3127277.1 two-component regulator propeller domain-containing protein [Rheinheimera sp. 1928-s]
MVKGLWSLLLGFVLLLVNVANASEQVRQVYSRFVALEQNQAHISSTALAQDHAGQIWLGTQHGLYRLNGSEVTVFRADATDPASLSADWISSLLVDQQGVLWVGTRYAGVNRFNAASESFSRVALPATINNGSSEISVLYQDPQLRIWVGSYGAGLFLLEPQQLSLTAQPLPARVDGVSSIHINDLLMAADGVLYLASGDAPLRTLSGTGGGLIAWHPEQNSAKGWHKVDKGQSAGSINKLHLKSPQHLMLASFSGGLLQLDISSGELTIPVQPATLRQAQLTDMLQDEAGGLWLASYNAGLWYQQDAGQSWQQFQHQGQFSGGLPGNSIYALMLDKQGTVWTINQLRVAGISRFARHIRTLPTATDQPQLLPASDVLGIEVVNSSTVWLANRQGGLLRFNPQQGRLEAIPMPDGSLDFSARQVRWAPQLDLLWTGSEQGLWQFKPKTQEWQPVPLLGDTQAQPVIKSLFTDSQQQLWVGTRGHGVFIVSADGQQITALNRYSKPGLPVDDINLVYQDSFGLIWIGSADQGLFLYNQQDGKLQQWQQKDASQHGLQFNGIQLVVEENRQLWIHAGNLRHRVLRSKNAPAQIEGFKPYLTAADDDTELRSAQLFRLLYRQHFLPEQKSYLNLDERLGVQSVTWIGSWAEHEGWLFRGGKEGLDFYKIDQLPQQWPLNSLKLTSLSLFNQAVQPARPGTQSLLPVVLSALDQLTLMYQQDMFSLHFSVPEFIQPETLRYRYQLNGFDRDWIQASQPVATYTRLPPGNYVWHAEASIGEGPWQTQTSLAIEVLPPWWMTWWFRTALVVLVLFSCFSWFQHKMKRQLEMRRQLELQVSLRTEELSQKTSQLQEKHQALQRSYQDITLLQQISREITASLDLKQVLTRCHSHLVQMLDAHVLLIGIYRETEHKLDFAFWMEDNQLAPRFDVDLEQAATPAVYCFNNQREMIIREATEFLEYLPMIPEPLYGVMTKSVLYFPLTVSGKAVGVFSVQSLKEQAYSDSQIELLRTLASYVAISVANADSFEQLQLTQQQLITQEKMAGLGSLVAGVAHEINTPLGICVTASSHLQTELDTVQHAVDQKVLQQSQFQRFLQHLREGLKILQVNTGRAADLVQSFKKVSVDQSNVSLREFNLATYVQDVVLTLKPQLHKAGCLLDVQCDSNLVIYSDPGAIAQIITNLVFNALIHGVKDRPDPRIQLSFSQEGRTLMMKFSDNGKGLDQRALQHLFEPFYTTNRNNGGTGLGAHIVYNLVTVSLKGSNKCCKARWSKPLPLSLNFIIKVRPSWLKLS